FVQQQFAFALGLVIAAVTALVRADMNVDEERLSPTKTDVSLAQVGAAVAQRLDLGARELDARLDRLQDEVVVERGAVGGNRRLLVALLLLPHQRRPRSQAAALIRRPPGGWTSSAT